MLETDVPVEAAALDPACFLEPPWRLELQTYGLRNRAFPGLPSVPNRYDRSAHADNEQRKQQDSAVSPEKRPTQALERAVTDGTKEHHDRAHSSL